MPLTVADTGEEYVIKEWESPHLRATFMKDASFREKRQGFYQP